MLAEAAPWQIHMNDGIVRSDEKGLHVSIAPGKKWAIAAAPGLSLPANTTRVHLKIGAVTGGGRWLIRLYGRFRGRTSAVDFSPFYNMAKPGSFDLDLDPRLLAAGTGDTRGVIPGGVMVQLGLEGDAGASVDFTELSFTSHVTSGSSHAIPGQISLPSIDMMPEMPSPYRMLNWKQVTTQLDRLIFDTSAKGQYLPLTWIDKAHINSQEDTFGMPSYVGDEREKNGGQEGVTCIGAVLGPSLIGIDKSKQQHNWVKMCEAFCNKANGSGLVLNLQNQPTGGSFWYEIWPHIAFYGLVDRYPGMPSLAQIMKETAGKWAGAAEAMNYNFQHTAYNFATGKPADNGQWKEPDAAAGIGWMELAAWEKFGENSSLQSAQRCIEALQQSPQNPYYENLLPWGVLAAARLNAETGTQFDVNKMLNWCFDISDTRGGWAATVQKWGNLDCAGLMGSIDNRGGYAFAMNSFAQAAALTPIARYDERYACALGKWMLNLANSSRLFYPKELPRDHQSSPDWTGDPAGCIAYEGLRREWDGKMPYATGDPVLLKWGPKTDLGLYGSVYSGMLSAIVDTTDVPGILQLNCLATDFFHRKAYPTYLVYNPYSAARNVHLRLPEGELYDAVQDKLIGSAIAGKGGITLAPHHAAVIAVVPHGARRTARPDGTVLYNDIPVRFAH
jgi:hypothetical protein